MGLISKTVKIKWKNSIKKYYESKGYVFSKYNDEFDVYVEDLPTYSSNLVEVECDYCKNKDLKPIQWQDYKKRVKEDGKFYCSKCIRKLFSIKAFQKTKLEDSISFEQWCIENNYLNYLKLWDIEKNNCFPSEIPYRSGKKYYFKCDKGIHESELYAINNLTRPKRRVPLKCRKCNSVAQYLLTEFGENAIYDYWSNKNTRSPWEIDYGAKVMIYIKCDKVDYHGDYKIRANHFTNGGRCVYCGTHKIHPLDSLGTIYPQVLKIYSDKNKKSPYEYSPKSNKEVWWKCENGIHEDYKRSINSSNNHDFRCPECTRERDESFLQEKVRLYLNELGYKLNHERNCSIVPINPKTHRCLPFDNEVTNLKLIIEVQGIQHYRITSWVVNLAIKNKTTPEQELHYIKLKDRYKRICAKSKGYYYLEIPYWTDNKNEVWKKLIDNKIKEIKNI